MCCHVGGDIDFDAAGNLYLSTGDDSNPFDSGGYTPIDERTNRNPVYDAQRSAGNTNDLRGKVLRIKVNAERDVLDPGRQPVPARHRRHPAGDLRDGLPQPVPAQRGQGRPACVYVGDYGPDAGTTSATRGPAGQVEFNRITSAGNYGWPYCTGSNTTSETYVDYVFPSGPSGNRFNCAAPVNNSPRNTGLTNLPAARPAWIKYDNCSLAAFGCGSESPMGGAVYRYDAANPSTVKFPAALDGHYFADRVRPALDQDHRRQRRRVGRADQRLPVARHAGHGQRVRPGRRAVRAGLRHRLGQRRRQLRAVPHRVQPGRQPGAGRPGRRQPHVRHRAADGQLLLGRLRPTPRAAR